MSRILKLLLIPLIYIGIDLYFRFPLFHLYNKWQLFFYTLSLLVSAIFFSLTIVFLSKLKQRKVLFTALILFFTIFLLISFVGSFIFYTFNGFFPNYFTLLYFKTEPQSAFKLLEDSVNLQDAFLFILVGIPVFLYVRYLSKKEYNLSGTRLILSYLQLALVYFFLFIYHKKFDQCMLVDTNFALAFQRHIIDGRDYQKFMGKGHVPRHPIKLKETKKHPKINILVVVLESMRSDRLQAYGYSEETTPNLEKFRQEHLDEFHVFKKAYTVSTTTMLAVPAILTGIGPQQDKELLQSQPIIWDYASKLNYKPFFISSHTMQWYRFYRFYQNEKLAHYWTKDNNKYPFFNDLGIDDKFTVKHLNEHINSFEGKPFFGVVQLNSTHYPYHVPTKYKKWNKNFSESYNNAVLYQDAVLKPFFENLKEKKLLENTVIIFVSDHAESLKDHNNIGHVDSYYTETISIPIMMYLPENLRANYPKKNLEENANNITANIDIAPTIIDLLKLGKYSDIKKLKENFKGYSLFAKIPEDREVIIMNNNEVGRFRIGVSLIKGNLHYLWRVNVVPNQEELYNLKLDPKEQKNIISLFSKNQLDDLKKNMMKYPMCRKYLIKYEQF